MQPYVMTLARWMARKAVKSQWRAVGRRPEFAEATELAAATNAHFVLHRNELIKEAWEHPVAQRYRHQEQMRLASGVHFRFAPKAAVGHQGAIRRVVPLTDSCTAANSAKRKTASRRPLRNPIRCLDQAAAWQQRPFGCDRPPYLR